MLFLLQLKKGERKMKSVTIKIDETIANKIKEFYLDSQIENFGEYVFFHAKSIDQVTITVYQSSKGFKALFSGEKSLEEALIWDENASLNVAKERVKTEWMNTKDQIGSDEVGTGDFFGPIIVVACFTDQKLFHELNQLGINDSKKLTDEKILEIVPKIIDKVIYSKLTCPPSKYNEMIEKGHSMNSIKAILHNEVLHNVRSKINSSSTICYVDQFCEPNLFYHYLEGKYDAIFNNIHFETKAESHYPSVALASMIARYSFIKYLQEIEEKYNITIPKGASKKVDEFALELKEKIGLEEVEKLIKKNFKNYQYLL